jgi:hypothetical protein
MLILPSREAEARTSRLDSVHGERLDQLTRLITMEAGSKAAGKEVTGKNELGFEGSQMVFLTLLVWPVSFASVLSVVVSTMREVCAPEEVTWKAR